MALPNEQEKEYIEFRVFILGDKSVGKNSLLNKFLEIPATATVHNAELEEHINKMIDEIKRQQKAQELALASAANLSVSGTVSLDDKTKSMVTATRSNMSETVSRKFIDKSKIIAEEKQKNAKNKNKSNLVPGTITSEYISEKSLNQKRRMPVREHPTKVYNCFRTKVALKFYCIPSAEELPYNFEPRDDEDSEYELEKEHKISLKGIKKDILEKLSIKETLVDEDTLRDYKIKLYKLFVFVYDMSNFYTFETLILYQRAISRTFKFSENDTFFSVIVANKKDKEVFLNKEERDIYSEFLKNTNLKVFEVSTKPYFNFLRFYKDFFFKMFSPTSYTLEQKEFKEDFNRILNEKINFAKSERKFLNDKDKVPGPEYEIMDVYCASNPKERYQAFENRKTRFYRKLFVNKTGPVLARSRSTNEVIKSEVDKQREKEQKLFKKIAEMNKREELKEFSGFVQPGFTMGIAKGKLNLLEDRKQLRESNNKSLLSSMEKNYSNIMKMKARSSRDEEYFQEAKKRKEFLANNVISKRKEKHSKILDIHAKNLESIERKKNLQKSNIFGKKLFGSSSTTDILSGNKSLDLTEKNLQEEKDRRRQKYYDIMFGKNREHIEKLEEKNSEREQLKLCSPFPSGPGPNSYDIRGNMLNPAKGPLILGKRRELRASQSDAEFIYFKGEFEKIAEKPCNSRLSYKERFEPLKKEPPTREYYDAKKWAKWEEKKKTSEKNINFAIFLQNREQRFQDHYDILDALEAQNDEIRRIRKEILVKKGYDDGEDVKSINYNQVEEASPKYSIRGRHAVEKSSLDDSGGLIIGGGTQEVDFNKLQASFPLPNFNYVKPSIKNVLFDRTERFPQPKVQEDLTFREIFKDGKFALSEREDFCTKEPFSSMNQRNFVNSFTVGPAPSDYLIKSNFDRIVEEGKKKSDNFERMKKLHKMEQEEKQRKRDVLKKIIISAGGSKNTSGGETYKNTDLLNSGDIVLGNKNINNYE